MKIMADKVHPDEPCWGYWCGPERRFMGKDIGDQMRILEKVFVIRGDAIACYEEDFGPASEYGYMPPLLMPSYGENPVGLMRWHGEQHRNDDRWMKRIAEHKESSTLFQDIIRQEEQRHEIIRNKSSFGPAVTVQRNEYPHEEVHRRYNDERARRTGRKQL